MNVCIVDDSELVRERLTAMLAELPGLHIVGYARDGLEALDIIRQHRPDAVILDIRMPGKNGFDVLKILKHMAHPPLVIILTNYPSAYYRERCLKAGADFFFEKANGVEQLLQLLPALAHKDHATTRGKSCIHAE